MEDREKDVKKVFEVYTSKSCKPQKESKRIKGPSR